MSNNAFLAGVSLFAGLSETSQGDVMSRMEVVQFDRDDFICKEGQAADSMFIIKSGIVQIFCDDGKGGRKILNHLKLGEYFGEMSLLTSEPRSASAVALAQTEVLRLKKDDFHKLVQSVPEVSLAIIRTLCERLAKANIASGQSKKSNVFAVMGPDNSSGKSFFTRNLATAIMDILQEDVLVFDPNLRDDRVARMLGVQQRSRIIDELVEHERLADIHRYTATAPCGLLTIVPQENGLTDLRIKEFHTFAIMKQVLETFKFVLVDSSSMFTKVTKDIVQSCDKIVYLISSKNVSISGLIEHFEETRRSWKVAPEKVVYGVNHMTDDRTKESLITEKDREILAFELPFAKELANHREPDAETLVRREPNHPISVKCRKVAEDILFDQHLGLLLPTIDDDPGKAELARRWLQSGAAELGLCLRNVEVKTPVAHHSGTCHLLQGRTAAWLLNDRVVKAIDFANRFKQEFGLTKIVFVLNGNESEI